MARELEWSSIYSVSKEWLTKSTDDEVGVWFVGQGYDYKKIGQHNFLLLINQNYDKISESTKL